MPLKVFYLDDESDLCEIFADIYGSDEVLVETFQEASKLIERTAESKPDLIFLDYRLQRTTGDEVAKVLDATIPKFLVSGEIQLKTSYPFVEIIKKPAPEEKVFEILKRYQSALK